MMAFRRVYQTEVAIFAGWRFQSARTIQGTESSLSHAPSPVSFSKFMQHYWPKRSRLSLRVGRAALAWRGGFVLATPCRSGELAFVARGARSLALRWLAT